MVGILLRSKMGEKGQVVIPKPIRERLKLQPDSEVEFDVEEDKVVLKKKKSGLEAYEEFINAFPKMKLPKHIDWDKEHYSQFE